MDYSKIATFVEGIEQALDNLAWNPADSRDDLLGYITDTQDMLNAALNDLLPGREESLAPANLYQS